jgi:hypothetical protein
VQIYTFQPKNGGWRFCATVTDLGSILADFRDRSCMQETFPWTIILSLTLLIAIRRLHNLASMFSLIFVTRIYLGFRVDLQNLYHVVFSDDFHTVSILDKKLEMVPGGEFALSSA